MADGAPSDLDEQIKALGFSPVTPAAPTEPEDPDQKIQSLGFTPVTALRRTVQPSDDEDAMPQGVPYNPVTAKKSWLDKFVSGYGSVPEVDTATAAASEVPSAPSEAVKGTGQLLSEAGKLSAAHLADTGLTLGGQPTGENVHAALFDQPNQPLPIEQQLGELGTVGGAVTKGLLGVARSAPAMAAATAAAPVVGPWVSFPAAFGTQAYGETGEVKPAAIEAAKAALFLGVGKIMAPVGTSLTANLVKRGVLNPDNAAGQKAVEALVTQVGFQTAAQLAELPSYAQLSPKERLLKFAESTAANTVFALPDVAHVLNGKVPSNTQEWVRQMVMDEAQRYAKYQQQTKTSVDTGAQPQPQPEAPTAATPPTDIAPEPEQTKEPSVADMPDQTLKQNFAHGMSVVLNHLKAGDVVPPAHQQGMVALYDELNKRGIPINSQAVHEMFGEKPPVQPEPTAAAPEAAPTTAPDLTPIHVKPTDTLNEGDRVQVIQKDGSVVEGTAIGADQQGNTQVVDHATNKTITIPVKFAEQPEESNAVPIQNPVSPVQAVAPPAVQSLPAKETRQLPDVARAGGTEGGGPAPAGVQPAAAGGTASPAKGVPEAAGLKKKGKFTASSWRQHFEQALSNTTDFPRPWEGRAEKERGKTIFYAVDANGKHVGDYPAIPGQTLAQQKAEFDSIIARANAPKEPTKSSTQLTPAKEPWQMTRKAWDKYIYTTEGGSQTTPRDIEAVHVRDAAHRQYVERAVREGKPVPPEVLAEYPDLAPPSGAPKTPEGTAPAAGVSESVPEVDEDMAFAHHLNSQKLSGMVMERLNALVQKSPAPAGLKKYFTDLLDWHRVRDQLHALQEKNEPLILRAQREIQRGLKRGENETLTEFMARIKSDPRYKSISNPYNAKHAALNGLLKDISQRFGGDEFPGYATSMYDLLHLVETASIRPGLKSPDQKQLANELGAEWYRIRNDQNPNPEPAIRPKPKLPRYFEKSGIAEPKVTYEPTEYKKGMTVGLKSGEEGVLVKIRKKGSTKVGWWIRVGDQPERAIEDKEIKGQRIEEKPTAEEIVPQSMSMEATKFYNENFDRVANLGESLAKQYGLTSTEGRDAATDKLVEFMRGFDKLTLEQQAKATGTVSQAVTNAVRDLRRSQQREKHGGGKVESIEGMAEKEVPEQIAATEPPPAELDEASANNFNTALDSLVKRGEVSQRDADIMRLTQQGKGAEAEAKYGLTPRQRATLLIRHAEMMADELERLGVNLTRSKSLARYALRRPVPDGLRAMIGHPITDKAGFLAFLDQLQGYDPRGADMARKLVELLPEEWFKTFQTIPTLGQGKLQYSGAFNAVMRTAEVVVDDSNPQRVAEEIMHAITTGLTADERQKVEQLRLADIAAQSDLTPEQQALLTAGVGSKQFLASGLDHSLYHLSNADEYFAHEALNALKGRPTSLWAKIVAYIKEAFRKFIDAARAFLGSKITPDKARFFDQILKDFESGKLNTSKLGGMIDPRNEIAYARVKNAEELRVQKARDEQAAEIASKGAYADFHTLFNDIADKLGVSEAAKRMLGLAKAKEIIAMADPGASAINDFKDAYTAVATASPGMKARVVHDAVDQYHNVQNKRIQLRRMVDDQIAKLTSPKFAAKLAALSEAQLKMDATEQSAQDFRQQISATMGAVVKEMNTRAKLGGATDALAEMHKRLGAMKDYSNAVAQKVDDIINVVSSTPAGYDLLWKGPSDGSAIHKIYSDIKRSTGTPLSGADIHLSSMAARVLGMDHNLARLLTSLKAMQKDPALKAAVDNFGKRFRNLLKDNPAAAVKFMVDRTVKSQAKATKAEQAWLSLHKEVAAAFKRLGVLQEMSDVHEAANKSPEWQSLGVTLDKLASPTERGRVMVPDVVIEQSKDNPLWLSNPATDKPKFISPDGTIHEASFGHTPAEAQAAWDGIGDHITKINDWLSKNGPDNPEHAWWLRQREEVDALYRNEFMAAPESLVNKKWKFPLLLPEFVTSQIKLPAAKAVAVEAANATASKMQTDSWVKNNVAGMTRKYMVAALNHQLTGQQYMNEVFSEMAHAVRNGVKLNPGVVLDSGRVVNKHDIAALKEQGAGFKALYGTIRNTGRQKVMAGNLLVDEHEAIPYLREAHELGTEPGVTVPRVFSDDARRLSTLIHKALTEGRPGDIIAALDQPNFQRFMRDFIGQRKQEYMPELSPFEDHYRAMADLVHTSDPDAPVTFQDYVDYILARGGEEFDTDAKVKEQLLNEVANLTEPFYKKFVEPDPNPQAMTIFTTDKDSAMTRANIRDVGPAFFYDYGIMNEVDGRAYAMDANTLHFTNLHKALLGLRDALKQRLDDFHNAGVEGSPQRKAWLESRKAEFNAGQEFNDYTNLEQHYNEVDGLIAALPKVVGNTSLEDAAFLGRFANASRPFSRLLMTGPRTLVRILSGSVFFQGLHYKAGDYNSMMSTARGWRRMAESAFRVGVPTIFKSILSVPGNMKRGVGAFHHTLAETGSVRQAAAESARQLIGDLGEIMQQSTKELRMMARIGLINRSSLGDKIANMILNPETIGRGPGAGGISKEDQGTVSRVLHGIADHSISAVNGVAEIIGHYFPGIGYHIVYDAAARQAGDMVALLEAHARKSYDYLKSTGGLAAFDLKNPGNPRNNVPHDLLLPSMGVIKTQSDVNMIRDWFGHTDLPFEKAVLGFWAKLDAARSDAERGQIHLMSSDMEPGPEADRVGEERTAQLMAKALADIHHATLTNRSWALAKNRWMQLINPFAGWTIHKLHEIPQEVLGRAPYDPWVAQRTQWAMTGLGVLALLALAPTLQQIEIYWQKWADRLQKEKSDARQLWEARNAAEFGKMLASGEFYAVPMLASPVNTMLGIQQGRGGNNMEPFFAGVADNILKAAGKMIDKREFFRPAAQLVGQMVPLTRMALNRLPGAEGIQEGRIAGKTVQQNMPAEIVKKQDFGGAGVKTPLSGKIEDMANAAFKGDSEGFQAALQSAIETATKMGIANPEKTIKASLAGYDPITANLTRKPTSEEYQAFLDRLSPADREQFTTAYQNFQQAAATLGMDREPVNTRQTASGGSTGLPAANAGLPSAGPTGDLAIGGPGGNLPAVTGGSGGGRVGPVSVGASAAGGGRAGGLRSARGLRVRGTGLPHASTTTRGIRRVRGLKLVRGGGRLRSGSTSHVRGLKVH